MNLLIAILRLLHIVSAFMWFGLVATMALYVAPAAAAAGENGLRYMKSLLTNTRIAMAIPIAAGVTVLVGIVLYVTGDVGNNFSNIGQIVLAIGAIFGLLAAVHGGAVSGRATLTFAETLTKYAADNQSFAAEELTTLRNQAMKVGTHSRISFVLMMVALIGMGSARYL